MTITAKVICDSIANGIRLTTLELYYPRYIHSQMLTHRMFSRNASSSRAIPVQKNIDAVLSDPAMPIHWGKAQKGMQANEELDSNLGGYVWDIAIDQAVSCAKAMMKYGYHKQIVNRLLEPFTHIKVICTATEWDGFFKLRLHEDSQPEIQELAKCMKEAMDNSTPNELKYGEWHLPYVNIEEHLCYDMGTDYDTKEVIKCSVARCARVSYLNHDNTNPNIEKDIELHDRLFASGHYSPMEHQATPMEFIRSYSWEGLGEGETHLGKRGDKWSGNLRGFVQYRQLIANK